MANDFVLTVLSVYYAYLVKNVIKVQFLLQTLISA